jgi:isochorismate pyruvate lyase
MTGCVKPRDFLPQALYKARAKQGLKVPGMSKRSEKSPEECQTMDDVRAEIDHIDGALVGLIAKRTRYIDRAIAIKAKEGLPAYIPERVEEVVANACAAARRAGAPEHIVETMWRVMVDLFIAREAPYLAGSAASPPPRQ